MENKKNVNCQFVTITGDGRKPDAEIHIIGFDEGKNMEIVASMEGHGKHIAHMLCNTVGELVTQLLVKDSAVAAAAFVTELQQTLADKSNKEIALLTMIMADRKTNGKMSEMLAKIMGDDDDDSEEDDSEEEGEE